MKTQFSPEQLKLIRGWEHDLNNAFSNFKYVHEEIQKDGTIRERIVSIQGSAIKELKTLLESMRSVVSNEKNLDEVANV